MPVSEKDGSERITVDLAPMFDAALVGKLDDADEHVRQQAVESLRGWFNVCAARVAALESRAGGEQERREAAAFRRLASFSRSRTTHDVFVFMTVTGSVNIVSNDAGVNVSGPDLLSAIESLPSLPPLNAEGTG